MLLLNFLFKRCWDGSSQLGFAHWRSKRIAGENAASFVSQTGRGWQSELPAHTSAAELLLGMVRCAKSCLILRALLCVPFSSMSPLCQLCLLQSHWAKLHFRDGHQPCLGRGSGLLGVPAGAGVLINVMGHLLKT